MCPMSCTSCVMQYKIMQHIYTTYTKTALTLAMVIVHTPPQILVNMERGEKIGQGDGPLFQNSWICEDHHVFTDAPTYKKTDKNIIIFRLALVRYYIH